MNKEQKLKIFGRMLGDAKRLNIRGHELVDDNPLFREVPKTALTAKEHGMQRMFLDMMSKLEKHYVKQGEESIHQANDFGDDSTYDPLDFFDESTPYQDSAEYINYAQANSRSAAAIENEHHHKARKKGILSKFAPKATTPAVTPDLPSGSPLKSREEDKSNPTE